MGSHVYFSNGKEYEGASEEAIQQMASFYTAVDFTIPEPLPGHPQLQPAQWPHHLGYGSSLMDIGLLQEWQTNQIINNNEPLMFDWQPEPTQTWNLERHNLDANPPTAHLLGETSPSPARTGAAFASSHFKFDKVFEGANAWHTGWAEDVFPDGGEVLPSVESNTGSVSIDVLKSVEMETVGRAPKRRRASPPALDLSDYNTTMAEVPTSRPSHVHRFRPAQSLKPPHVLSSTTAQPYKSSTVMAVPPDAPTTERAPVSPEKRRRAPTPTIEFPEHMSTTMKTTTKSPTTELQSPPPLIPSVRVIVDDRVIGLKSRRGNHAVFKTQSANAKRGHYASDVWEGHKAAIKKLYIDEGQPLREVMKTMEKQHNFPATQRMYKARFKQWGFVKNNTEKVVSQILRTKFERDAAGKLSQFTRNGKDVNLQNYLQRKGLTEYDLVDFQANNGGLIQVRCRTPPLGVPEDLRLPDRLRFQDTFVMAFKRSYLLWRQEDQDSAFGCQPSVFTWRVTDFPHLNNLIESARLIRSGDGASGVAALNQAFRAMEMFLASMDATACFYFFFHRQSRPWQEDARISLAVWKFLAAYASARNHNHNNSHPLFHAFKLMYEVIQKEGVAGLRELLTESSNTVADELERAFGREHWLKDLIWHRCFPEKSKLRHLQLIRDLRDHGPTKKIVKRLY